MIDITRMTAAMDCFSQTADIAKNHAGEILSMITLGHVPSEEIMQGFTDVVNQLQKHYDIILRYAQDYLSEDEMPGDVSVTALVDAVEQKQKKAIQKKLLASCLVLQRFVSVKSYLDTYAQALEPYQKKAELLLDEIDNGKLETVDNSPVLEGSLLFMRALETEDLESNDGLTALESLDEFFPSKVQLGIARKQYYLDEGGKKQPKNLIADNNEVIDQSPANSKSDKVASMPVDVMTGETTEISSIEDTVHGIVDVTETVKPATEELQNGSYIGDTTRKTDESETIEENNSADILGDEETGTVLYSINKVKKSNPSASAFKKDVPKLPKEAFTLLPLFTNLGALSELQAFKFGVAMGCFVDDDIAFSSVKSSLSTLSNKSLLASFDLDGEIVYCLTSYCNGCLRKETIQQSKLFEISFGKYSIVSDASINQNDLKKVINYNDLLLSYFYGIKEHTSKEDYQIIKTSLVMKDGYYKVNVLYAGTPYSCLLHDGTTGCSIDADNLLIVGDHIASEDAEIFENVFLYKNGMIVRVSEKHRPNDSNEIEESENIESTKIEEFSNNNLTATVKTNLKEFDNISQETKEKSTDEEEKSQTDNDSAQQSIQEDKSEDNVISVELQKESTSSIAVGYSIMELIEGKAIPDDNTCCVLSQLIASGNLFSGGVLSDVMRAALFAKTASLSLPNSKCARLAQKLLLSTHLPIGTYQYSSETISDALSDCDDQYLKMSIYMQALLTPASSYDYMLYQLAGESFREYDTEFPSLASIKPLFNKLLSVHEVIPTGFTASVMGLLGDATARRQYSGMLQNKAKNLLILPNIKTRIRNLSTLYNKCFGVGSEIYDCIKGIADGNIDEYDWVREVLTQYCDANGTELVISEEKIASILDATWEEVNPKNPFVLEYGTRDKILREFDSRLLLMKSWVEHNDQSDDGKLDVNRINVLKKELISFASTAAQEMSVMADGFSGVLRYALWFINCYLTDPENTHTVFREFLYTGVFSVDEDWIPILDISTINIKYYEPWRRVLKHISSPIRTSAQARTAIVDEVGSCLFDNLHQLMLLDQSETDKGASLSESQIKDARKSADDRTKKFKENLELAYTYNRISEPEKEKLATIMEEHKSKFFEIMDFGCWSQFLDALEKIINELASEKKKALRRELDARKQTLHDGETSTILDEAEILLENAMNFAVTEEYFNRFDNGEREFSDDLYAILHEEDSFATFLSDDVFRPLQQECENHSGRALKAFAWNYLEARVPRNWSVRQRDDSRKLVENWPTRKGASTATTITALFTGLGFTVKKAERGSGKKEEFFKLDIEPTAKSMADYRHPISLFGTQMKSPLNVVVLYGNYAPKQLVDTITGLDFGGMTIVLIDRPIDRAARRQIGEIFHTQTSGQNPFILIDQVLILHLATYQVTERLPVMLKCTLPYTSYQPFVRDGGSTTDEMFCGRSKELGTIIDPNGASVVYGGRQLGKTALLQRAESRCSNPANKSYAVYCNIIDCCNEEALVSKITEDILRKTNLNISKTTTISGLCKQIDQLFRTNKVQSLLLLLDEADRFLSAIADNRYKQLQPLIDLKRETTNKFKFVLAGLHNVCRAKNATSENGVFGQLGTPLCVKPLSPTDALQLLSRPLKYLGFEIDRYPHLETILTNTNYYPGILQFFGYNLVEAFTTQYGRYYRAVDGNPPFTLQDDQLGAVMNDADLNRSIRDKFRWSLELDPRYFMLARCITMLYYLRDEDTENWLGFSVEDIMGLAENDYSIHCLETCGKTDYVNLLDEMVEMGILSKPATGLYRLRRNSFVNIIGSDFDSLDADIINNNVEVQQ